MKPPRKVAAPALEDLSHAFQRLLERYKPHQARKLLDACVHDNSVRVWRDAVVVNPNDLDAMGCYVHAEQEPDGRWRCTIRSTALVSVGLGHIPVVWSPETRWQVNQVEIDALFAAAAVPSQSPPPPRGPAQQHDWVAIAGEIARRCHDQKGCVRLPASERKLAKEMLDWCRETRNVEPAESAMRDWVAGICAALRGH